MPREYNAQGNLVERRKGEQRKVGSDMGPWIYGKNRRVQGSDRRMPKTVCLCEYSVPIEEILVKYEEGWIRKVTCVMCPKCLSKRQVKT